jgi:hypothetical protein
VATLIARGQWAILDRLLDDLERDGHEMSIGSKGSGSEESRER